ncbi:MAG: efflux RND transporter periplasmic adaptor subunit [Reyranella sp.]|uniref:efflux RND transporter periplasmic adaptor subunit n=1 Tax=Reyranella sp. TaxID=1929291 RepID=UPI001ACB3A98|nr:efflux RND transporter periplasmic adaptor subunit [Reyranella sp.]MBN9087979.1 efflux RND transporter periplasmic adaptor subunit [Reyranella sp.]
MSPTSAGTPTSRRLLLAGAIFLLGAGGIVATGLVQRSQARQQVQNWTQQQLAPTVALARIEHGGATRPLTLPATIQPFYRASIFARVNGYLAKWNKDIGAHVKQGEVLASIDTPDLDQQLAQAMAALASAKANYDIAVVTSNRNNALLKQHYVAQQVADVSAADASAKKALMDADAANVRQLETMESFKQLAAPFDGVVTARNTDIGALIGSGNSGQPMFELADLHRVRVYVHVPQALSGYVQAGQKATFDMPQYPGRTFEAEVTTMSNAMDAKSRTMLVELQADNGDGKLFAGVYAQVHLELPADPNMVRLPATALVVGGTGAHVAVIDGDGKAALRAVTLGRDFGDSVEVTAGLAPSDRVIDNPPETIRNGDPVSLAPRAP